MPQAISQPAAVLVGEAAIPGDKSVSHRALILGALAVGETRIDGLLEGEDVMRTAACLRALGAKIAQEKDGSWRVHGVGIGGLAEPDDVLDMGNAGTGARLLIGLLATHPLTATVTGDDSLRGRPMQRIVDPLSEMGATFRTRSGCRLPLTVDGAECPMPIEYRLPVPSAQVKSAVLLAGLNAPGETTVVEAQETRDHTERMLPQFGAEIAVQTDSDGARRIILSGQPELQPAQISVPSDFSSAAFPLVAALTVPDSQVTLRNVGLNPHRTGLLESLREMGADIREENRQEISGEPVANLTVRTGALKGIEVPAERAPSMIDEYPVLAAVAAIAEGRTVMRGLGELRVKESDRLAAIADGLAANGVEAAIEGDDLVITGANGPPPGGGMVEARGDHRIAMGFLVLGAAAKAAVTVDDASAIATSFPGFTEMMNNLGAAIGSSEPTGSPKAAPS